jgi:Spy/CpxP family protein refolding chaperone
MKMFHKALPVSLSCVLALAGAASAQIEPPPLAPGGGITIEAPGPDPGGPQGDRVFFTRRVEGPMGGEMGLHHGPMGKWWKNSELVQQLGINDTQVQQIEKSFQDHRLQLIDLHANLEKQEALLEPMIEADRPDEAQVISQIDKVAQARAALEKSNAQMMLGIRRVLTPDQWKKLQAREHSPRMFFRRVGPGEGFLKGGPEGGRHMRRRVPGPGQPQTAPAPPPPQRQPGDDQ